MADIDLLPPEVDYSRPAPRLDVNAEPLHLTGELHENGVWGSLVSSFRDVFFPVKLPPLVLESKPIPVPDRMATKMTKKSVGISVSFYVLVILLIAVLIRNHVQLAAPVHKVMALVDVKVPPPPVMPKADKIGGGGGAHDMAPVSKGHLPKLVQQQIVPPMAPPKIKPLLAVPPSVVVQPNLKLATNNMPNIGMPNSPLSGVSLGNGSGGGLGGGAGNGIGPGSGGNIGGGFMHIGGSVRAPVLIHEVDPEFSDEARKAKFSGNVEVYLIVDKDGNPTHIQVARGVGMGLDQKAVEAVRQYKFKPAMQNGKPVAVDLYVDVNFQIF